MAVARCHRPRANALWICKVTLSYWCIGRGSAVTYPIASPTLGGGEFGERYELKCVCVCVFVFVFVSVFVFVVVVVVVVVLRLWL